MGAKLYNRVGVPVLPLNEVTVLRCNERFQLLKMDIGINGKVMLSNEF